MGRPFRVVLASALVLTGCSALIGVNDIFLDPSVGPGSEGGPGGEGSTTDGPVSGDGGADVIACQADFQTDKKHCGRCGHDCFGGTCNAGKCEGIELAAVADAPFFDIAVSAQHVFISTRTSLTTQKGGIWRVAKTGGAPELYVMQQNAEAVAVLGDKIYFVVDEVAAATFGGGFYSCPILGAAPCTPTRIAQATSPRGLTIDKGKVFYGDREAGKGLMVYTPGTQPPTVFRLGYGFSGSYFVDGQAVFYTATIFSNPQRAKLIEVLPDASANETFYYENATASDGNVQGNPASLFFTAYDYQATTGGIVRRIPRTGGGPCDYGGNANLRPYGIFADKDRIYWTNQGEGAAEPFIGGSLASCELAGCCTAPDVMWTGDGQPTAVIADTDAVYFTTKAKGSLWKIAKP